MIIFNLCNIGATTIGKILEANSVLKVLSIGGNPIGDGGIKNIIKFLNNSQIRELRLWNCGITDDGAISLAKLLQFNCTVQKIDLAQNKKITEDAAITILKAAVDNGVCQEVSIDRSNKTSTDVMWLMETLSQRKKITGAIQRCQIVLLFCIYRSKNQLEVQRKMHYMLLNQLYTRITQCKLHLIHTHGFVLSFDL